MSIVLTILFLGPSMEIFIELMSESMNDQKMDYSNQIHQRPQLEHPRQNEKET